MPKLGEAGAEERTSCMPDFDYGAVKDAQHTKTTAKTRRTLSVIWGTNALPGRPAQTEAWYRELLEQQGVTTEAV